MFQDHRDNCEKLSVFGIDEGARIGHFQITKKISSDDMSEVYLARDAELERPVALKFLTQPLCRDELYRARFKQEARAIAALNHPNITGVYEVGDYQGRLYAAFEYVDGQSLRSILGDESLSIHRALDLAIQICKGLDEAHSAGIIHRDLTPDNIIVDAKGLIRLFGYGSARPEGKGKPARGGPAPARNSYMSIEEAEGRQADQRDNIFTVGIILYEMLAGRHPYQRDSETATRHAIENETPKPAGHFRPGVSAELQRIIDKTLDKNRETRYQQIGELLDDLERERSEYQIRESEEKYRKVYEDSVIGFYRTTPEGRILMVNPALLKMLGYSVFDELSKRNLENSGYEPEYPRSVFKDCVESEGKVIGLESAWVRADGSTLWVRESARAIRDEKGNTLYYEGTVEDITERKRAEEALRKSEASYRSLFENMLEGVYQTRPDGTILSVNPALVQMLGYDSRDELCGITLAQDFYVNPEDREVLAQKLETQGELRNVEFRLKRKDGKEIMVLENARVVRDEQGSVSHYEGVLTDITEHKQAEEALRATHEQLEATLNALPDLLFEVDRRGRIFEFRAPNPELLYCQPVEFLGEKVDRCLPRQAAETVMGAIDEAVETGRSSGAIYSLEILGTERWFELSVSGKGNHRAEDAHFVALVRDITERKKSENMLRKATQELKTEHDALQEKNIALKQILEHIEKQRQDDRLQIYKDLDQALAPFLRKLKEKTGPAHIREIEALEINLSAILAKDSADFKSRYARLTSRESEICDMIKGGMSSKQISDSLNLSILTVLKHREQIRKKLGITNQAISLATYLRSH
jgi:PAS domain S-box-containing protein